MRDTRLFHIKVCTNQTGIGEKERLEISRMRKKRLAVTIMCAALGISMISGCGKSSDKDKKSKETTKEATTTADAKSATQETTTDPVPVEKVSKLKNLADYKGLEVEKSTAEITDDKLKQQLEYFKDTYPEKKTEGTVKNGDTVNIDFVGKKDGKEFSGGTATGQDLTIGSNTYIEGFESGLIGKKVGEKVTLNLTFPTSYQNTELAGKDVTFDVTINYIKNTNFDIDKEFIETNFAYSRTDNVKDFDAWVKKKMKFNAIYQAIWSNYLSSCTMESYGEDELKDAKTTVAEQIENNIKNSYGMTVDQFKEQNSMSDDDYTQEVEASAKNTIKMKLVVEAIAAKENIEISDQEYQDYLEDGANQTKTTVEKYEEQYGKDNIKQQVLSQKVLEFVCDNVKIVPDATTAATEAATTEAATTK